jgi:SAM-dependent methyltransferase
MPGNQATDSGLPSTPEARARVQYELEKLLARRILDAAPRDRARVAAEAYDELFAKAPWHPELGPMTPRRRRWYRRAAAFYRKVIRPGDAVLDVGCGRGELLSLLAPFAGRAVGVEVSGGKLVGADLPAGVSIRAGSATAIPFEAGSFDVVITSEVLEHLHPDDVPAHLAEVRRVLRPGGRYATDTPSRLTGPHDISRAFEDVAAGLHLKEWTVAELDREFRSAGFRRVRVPLVRPPLFVPLAPSWTAAPKEWLMRAMPCKALRRAMGKVLGMTIIFLVAEAGERA